MSAATEQENRLAVPWARDLAKKIRQLKGMSEKQCERVLCGMVDGMAFRTVEYPNNKHMPGIRPAFDVDYERGYDVGESFARAATVMQDAPLASEDTRKD